MRSVRTTLAVILCCAAVMALPHEAPAQPAPGGGPTAAATPQQKAKAKQKFILGKRAFAAGRYEEALASFRESYGIVPSPNSHLMMVHALSELGRQVEAYDEALAVSAEAEEAAKANPKYGPTAQAARDEADKIKARVGIVTVTVEDVDLTVVGGSSLTVGGRPIEQDQWGSPITVAPGAVEVVLTTPEGPSTQTVDVAAGQDARVTIGPPKPEVPTGTGTSSGPIDEPVDDGEPVDLTIPAYVAGGVGAAGLIMFGIFGGLTLSEYGDLEEQCPNNTCAPGQSADGDSGKTYQTVANVSLVVGIVGVATGATLLIVEMAGGSEDETLEDDTTPTVAVGPGSIAITGRF